MAPKLIALSKFIDGVESGLISDVFSLVVGSEKRVYGRSPEDAADKPKRFFLVYAVLP